MTHDRDEEHILRILFREIRNAPLRFKVFKGAAVLYILGMLTWALQKRGWASLTEPTVWGALMGAASGMLIGFSFALFTLAQEDRACMGTFRLRLRTRRMHPMLLALPTLCLIGAMLSVAATTIFVSRLDLNVFLAAGLPTMAVLWCAIHGVRVSTRFLYDYAREQAELAATAREEATTAQLAALQAQLNPHFLFNALNTVASLVRTDGKRAEATVENLARILRRTLDRSTVTSIPLSDELDYVRAYLSIEQERFGARLAVDWEIEPGALGCRVPPMTLQPLVENSLKHGLSKRLDGGRVRIGATRRNGSLHLRVDDDGPGFAPRAKDGTGLGNLRRRLDTLFGEAASVHVNGGSGASVELTLPADI